MTDTPAKATSDEKTTRHRGKTAREWPKPDWVTAGVAFLAFLLAAGLTLLTGNSANETVGPGLVAVFVAVAARFAPRAIALKAALVIGLLVFLALMLALVTTGSVIAAGLTMAVIAFITGMGQSGGPVAAGVSSVVGVGYLVPALLGLEWDRSLETSVILGVLGLVAGLAVAIGVILLKREEEHEKMADPDTRERVSPFKRLAEACRHPGPARRYAIERAILLGSGMAIYQATASHAVFWVVLTMFIVLAPDAASTWQKAVQRASGVIVGALAVGILAQFVPGEILIGLGLVALLVGSAFQQSDYWIWAAAISFLIIAIFGTIGENGDGVLAWAGLRVLDTLIGVAIAVVGAYLIRPRKGNVEPKPGAGSA